MGQIKATVAISGTDDNGVSRSFSATGSMYCVSLIEGDFTATTTKQKVSLSDNGSQIKMIYLENYGTVDVSVGYDDGSATNSFCVPAGASALISGIKVATTLQGPSSITVWSSSSTAQVHYVIFC